MNNSSVETVEISAPCRIDMGGTLDISTFHYPLRHINPCTFNIALNLRTHVRVKPFNGDMVQVESKGFETATCRLEEAPFNHPLGLMFAVAAYFNVRGISIGIESSSPPCSALGGSSSAASALVSALSRISGLKIHETPELVTMVAFGIEGSIAGVPCGIQDQLAAVYGGVNAWYWEPESSIPYRKEAVLSGPDISRLESHILVAYCGIQHDSKDINGRWARQFVSGRYRRQWEEIAVCTESFVKALSRWDIDSAVEQMNREVDIRMEMTPDVLDDMGRRLVESARKHECGGRFTGAGGGGCLWALGDDRKIELLRREWIEILSDRESAGLLNTDIDTKGLKTELPFNK